MLPLAPKSFCMSTTIAAVFETSIVEASGFASMVVITGCRVHPFSPLKAV
jgi:hypothetical protein